MPLRPSTATSFFAVGIAFIAIGTSVNRAFLPIGVAFMIIGLVRMRRR
jgi:hypothetical protein